MNDNTLPTFRLEEINFEGPLTLILQLLSRNRVEIRDVKIAVILEQYLQYLDDMQKLDLEIAGEFVAMAAHLTYLKARAMLEEEDDVSEIELLLQSLEALKRREGYGAVLAAAERFAKTISFETFVKPPEPLEPQMEYRYAIDLAELYNAFRSIAAPTFDRDTRSERVRNAMPAPLVYDIEHKSEEILVLAASVARFRLRDVLEGCGGKSEMVAAFLALLELIREGRLVFDGTELTLASAMSAVRDAC